MIIDALFASFLAGLLGSVHCFGMCGGIVGALQLAIPNNTNQNRQYLLLYNLGRLSAYTLLGLIAGFIGSSAIKLIGFQLGLNILRLISALFLILMAGYIGRWWTLLTKFEAMGSKIFNPFKRYSKRWIPLKRPIYAIPLGMLWGFLPCGLVYSAISFAVSSSSIFEGGLKMFSFGLGTIPSVLFMGGSAHVFQSFLQNRYTRLMASFAMIIIAIWTAFPAIKLFMTLYLGMPMSHH